MVNTLLTPRIIAREALIALEDNTVLLSLVHKAFTTEFKSIGSTIEIRKPAVFTSTNAGVTGTAAVQNVTQGTVQLVLDQLLDVSWNIHAKEMATDIVSFSEETIQPAMRAHAEKIDNLLAARYVDIANFYEVSSTPAVADIAGVNAVLNVNQAPFSERRLVMAPMTQASYISLDAFLNADKRGDGGRALKSAFMGRVMGMDTYMDQNMNTHPATGTAYDGTALLNGAATVGQGSINFDSAVTSAGTVEIGAVFKIKGVDQWMLCSIPSTIDSSTGHINFTPVTNATIADNEVIDFIGGHSASLAFHKNAFTFASAPLDMPMGGAKGFVLTYRGVSARVVYDYDIGQKQNMASIDILCGVKTLDSKLAARLADTRNR